VNAASVRSVQCPCRATISTPCTPHGDHLARYLRAEATGVIARDQLHAAITTLIVITPFAVITATPGQLPSPRQGAAPPAVPIPASEGAR
jgi:hypothetical protein